MRASNRQSDVDRPFYQRHSYLGSASAVERPASLEIYLKKARNHSQGTSKLTSCLRRKRIACLSGSGGQVPSGRTNHLRAVRFNQRTE